MLFMRIKTLLWRWGWISAILCLCFCVTNCSGKQGEPKLELLLQKLDPDAREIIVQLVVTNVGEDPLVIPHLREEGVKQSIMWAGWVYHIQRKNPDEFYGPYGYSWDRPPDFKKQDLIRLKPGEYFSLTLNIADAKWMSPYDKDYRQPRPELVDVAGEYEVNVRLSLGTDSMGESNIPLLLHWTVWQGYSESNTITFVIEQEHQDQPSQEEHNQTLQE